MRHNEASGNVMESGRRNFRDRALPALFILLGALGWSVCSAASAAIGLYARNRLETDHVADIITLFFTGGFFGWLLALAALRVLPALKSQQLRLATACLAIAFFTLAVAAALFAFEYRIFYAQWHAPTFSRIWFSAAFHVARCSLPVRRSGTWSLFSLRRTSARARRGNALPACTASGVGMQLDRLRLAEHFAKRAANFLY